MKKIFLFIFAIFLISGCIPKNITNKGYILDNEEVSQITVGLTNKENVLKHLGYPLNRSYFNENIWIYYSYQSKEFLFFKPTISEQKVLVIEFDDETDIVKNLSLYSIDSNNFKILDETTDINTEKEGIIKDILRNIGQFSM